MNQNTGEYCQEVVVDDLNEKKPIRVLHVDDELCLLKITEQCLEMQGQFQVDKASSVEEATDKMKEEKYDVVISDYQMPGKDGLEFLKELRARGNGIPFIIFTGKGREEVIIQALNLGADHYVNKNGDPETVYFELSHCLRSVVKEREAEVHAKETAKRLETICQNAFEGISLVNREENFVYANKALGNILGCNENQLVGMNLRNFLDEEGWAKLGNETEERQKGKSSRYELVFHRIDGATRDVQVSSSPLFDTDGSFAGTVGIVLDITGRKKAEEEIRRMSSAVEQSIDGIAILDSESKLTYVNNAFADMHGYSREEMIGMEFPIVHTEEGVDGHKKYINQVENQGSLTCELRHVRKDGTTLPIRISLTLLKGEDGRPTGILAVTRDITEVKKTEEGLRESEVRYRSLVEQALQGIVVAVGPTPKLVFANLGMSKILGYTPEELTSLSPPQTQCLVHPDDRQLFFGRFKDRLEGKSVPSHYEVRGIRKDGTVVWLCISSTRIEYGGKPAVQAIFTDETERRQTEVSLRACSRRFEKLFESEMVGVVISGSDDRISSANPTAARILGYSGPKEIVSRLFADLYIDQEQREMLSRQLREKGFAHEFRLILKRKDNTQVCVKANAMLYKDTNGKVLRTESVFTEFSRHEEVEEELMESEGRFRSLFESIQDPVGIFVGKEGRLIDYNTAFRRSSGYSDEELKGRAFLDFVHPDDHAMVLKKYKTEYSEGELPLVYEIRGINKKGESIPLEISVSTYRKKGRAIGIEVIHRNITERKCYERRLSALNIHGRNLNTAKSMEEIYELTLDAMEKTLGFEFADLFMVKENMLQLVTHRGKTRIPSLSLPMDGDRGITVRAARTDKPILVPDISKEEAYVEGEEGGRSELAVPIQIGPKVLGVLNVESKELDAFDERDQELLEILASHTATAISNLDRARELGTYAREIRESKQRFEGLFLGNPEATICLAPDFSILDINPRFEELFGHPLSEIKGKHIDEVVVPKDKIKEAEMLNAKAVKGYVYHDTLRAKKDGSLVPVSISAAPVEVEGKLVGYIGVYKDVTEQKSAERKLALMNEKLRVVGGLTRHDVRNKLSAITGNAYLLKKQLAGDRNVLDKLKDMEAAVEQTVRIFDFVKAYEMLGAEELVYVDVKKTVSEAISLLSGLKDVKAANECHGLNVLADSLLRQLFYNLIDNSLKYGERLTQITIHYEKTQDNQLKLTYEDDGIGISDDAKQKLFAEGFTTGKGSGYGLYLIKRMTEFYGWTIEENGEPGKGARFVMTIPRMNKNGKENYRIAL